MKRSGWFQTSSALSTVLMTVMFALCGTAQAEARALILGFHHIGVKNGVTYEVDQTALERQLRSLLDMGYVFVTVGRVSEALATSPLVASVTFDDGYLDVYSEALPVLQRLGVPATVFVIVTKVNEPGFMSWKQLKELRSAGWDVASHTMSHAELTDLSPPGLERELAGSHEVLMKQLGSPVSCVAYPFGRHDKRVRQIAAMRYSCGVTTAPGLNTTRTDAWALRRPLSNPLDAQGLGWRAATGVDLRVALLGPAFAYLLLPVGEEGRSPALYNPARYELMGDGQLGFRWQDGNLYLDAFSRMDNFAISAVFSRIGTTYMEVTGNVRFSIGTVSAGWSTEGPMLATALPLGGYGEVWGRLSPQSWALGTELIPMDYTRLRAALDSSQGLSAELGLALPVLVTEGRPLGIFFGHGKRWYVGSSLRLGSFETNLNVDEMGTVGLAFSSSW